MCAPTVSHLLMSRVECELGSMSLLTLWAKLDGDFYDKEFDLRLFTRALKGGEHAPHINIVDPK